MIYMDASALITLFTGREGSKELREFLKERRTVPLATSTIGFVETVRTNGRHGQVSQLEAELESAVTELILTEEIRDKAMYLPGKLKTLDALHVASALSIADYLTVLVSYDRRMLEVADTQGLPVASPGMN